MFFKLFVLSCLLAFVASDPKPGVLAAAYTAPVAYTAPLAYSAYTAPVAYSAYSAPIAAYSAYPYASPYSYFLRR